MAHFLKKKSCWMVNLHYICAHLRSKKQILLMSCQCHKTLIITSGWLAIATTLDVIKIVSLVLCRFHLNVI